MVFVIIATQCSRQWANITTFFPVKKLVRLSEDGIQRDSKKKEIDEIKRRYIRRKVSSASEMWEGGWFRL